MKNKNHNITLFENAVQGRRKQKYFNMTPRMSFRFTAYAKNMPCTLSYVFELKSNLNQSKLT